MYGCVSLLAMLYQYQQIHGRSGGPKCMALLVFGVWLSFFFFSSDQPFYLVAVSKVILFPVLRTMAQGEPVCPRRQTHTHHK